jgi:hypothetical protein
MGYRIGSVTNGTIGSQWVDGDILTALDLGSTIQLAIPKYAGSYTYPSFTGTGASSGSTHYGSMIIGSAAFVKGVSVHLPDYTYQGVTSYASSMKFYFGLVTGMVGPIVGSTYTLFAPGGTGGQARTATNAAIMTAPLYLNRSEWHSGSNVMVFIDLSAGNNSCTVNLGSAHFYRYG